MNAATEQPKPEMPRDSRGRIVSRQCPECDCGTLQCVPTGYGFEWVCDGLADPNDDDKPLEACTYSRTHGKDE